MYLSVFVCVNITWRYQNQDFKSNKFVLIDLKSAEMFSNGQHSTDDVIHSMADAYSFFQVNAFTKWKLNFRGGIHRFETTIQRQNFTPRVLQQ